MSDMSQGPASWLTPDIRGYPPEPPPFRPSPPTDPPPTDPPARGSARNRRVWLILFVGGAVVAVSGLVFAVVSEIGLSSPSGSWPLTYDFDHGSGDFGIGEKPLLKTENSGGVVVLTVKSQEPVSAGVAFNDPHAHLAVQMDLMRRSGSVAGTAFGPACIGDREYAFVISDNGDYRIVRADSAGMTTLTGGSDPTLTGADSRLVRVECVSDGTSVSVDGYIGVQLITSAQDPTPAGPFTKGGVIAQTDSPPAEIVVDNFRAESAPTSNNNSESGSLAFGIGLVMIGGASLVGTVVARLVKGDSRRTVAAWAVLALVGPMVLMVAVFMVTESGWVALGLLVPPAVMVAAILVRGPTSKAHADLA